MSQIQYFHSNVFSSFCIFTFIDLAERAFTNKFPAFPLVYSFFEHSAH